MSDAALQLVAEWRPRSKEIKPDALVFSTGSGKPISPNVLRRHVFPACDALGLKRVTWLTLRRTYSSWGARDRVSPGRLVRSFCAETGAAVKQDRVGATGIPRGLIE